MEKAARESDVTVVLPVYNVGEFIQDTLESLKTQSRPPCEVIVVNDCSTDDTVARVKAAKVPGLRLLSTERNMGPWFARNLALEAATSRWITFIDGDDWYRPQRLETLCRVAEEYEADFVVDDMRCYDQTGRKLLRTSMAARTGRLDGPMELHASEFVELDLGVMKPLIRREFLEREGIRFNGELRSGGDFSMFATCLMRGAKGLLWHEALYCYRFRPGQITSDRTKLFSGTWAATLEAIEEAKRLGDHEALRALSKRKERVRHQRTLNRLLQSVRGRDVRGGLRALAEDPGAMAFLIRKLSNPRLVAEKIRLRRL